MTPNLVSWDSPMPDQGGCAIITHASSCRKLPPQPGILSKRRLEILQSPLHNRGPRSNISSWGGLPSGSFILATRFEETFLERACVGRVRSVSVSVCTQSSSLLPSPPEQAGGPGILSPSQVTPSIPLPSHRCSGQPAGKGHFLL